jgi:hypothetical protein
MVMLFVSRLREYLEDANAWHVMYIFHRLKVGYLMDLEEVAFPKSPYVALG